MKPKWRPLMHSALHQYDLAEPSVVVVRRYTNTPYIPWGTSHFLYLDMSTLSGGASSTQFPLDWLHLHSLLPFSDTEVVLPQGEGEVALKVFPHSWEVLWQTSEEEQCLSDPVLLLVPSSTPLSHQLEGTQTEEESGFHPALQWLQDVNHSRVQLECKLGQEAQELARRYDDHWIKLARRHERKQAKMAQEANATFQEVFTMVCLTDLIKPLPWCVSSAVLFHYMSEVLATTMQQDENVQTTAAAPEPEGITRSWSLKQSSSSNWNSTSFSISLTGYPLCRYSPSGVPISWAHCQPHTSKRVHVCSQEVKVRSEHSSVQGDEDMPELVPEAGPALHNKCRNLPAPLLIQLGPPLILMMDMWQDTWGVLEIRSHQTQTCQGRMWLTLIWTQPPETVSHAEPQTRWL